MDQKRMLLAIAISVAIILGFQLLMPHTAPVPNPAAQKNAAGSAAVPAGTQAAGTQAGPGTVGAEAPKAAPDNGPKLAIDAPRVEGSISLTGARLDHLVLRDYHETIARDSKLVELLAPAGGAEPTYVQFGWSAAPGETVKLPDSTTLWTSSGGQLTPTHPVTLSWDNGEGLVFTLGFAVDDNYMFTVTQGVRNSGTAPAVLYPWQRISRDYTPVVLGTYLLHEGLTGVLGGTLKEMKYTADKSDAKGHADGTALDLTTTGGWAGITDKYWLTALIPAQNEPVIAQYRYEGPEAEKAVGPVSYQALFLAKTPETIAPNASVETVGHVFAGAKVVTLLDQYEQALHIPSFDKAVDFGWFYFITKPFFFALDWLNTLLGNFGLAIILFTFCLKLVFFPLANYSYRSMSKMKMLGPKMTALKEVHKDDPQALQRATMALYKAEGVNPASGCLPMLIQIPIFFSLYKVLYVTIEMRHAPFYGWIHDLSAEDPTNVFNLFGLIPFDPGTLLPMLHLGALPVIMGLTSFMQQRLNPPPPDATQAKVMQFMPVLMTFMLARFPAGLVLYWTTNNLLTMAQQWWIMRSTKLSGKQVPART
jgi:YidC/Oxa1 family membrane protein insertase